MIGQRFEPRPAVARQRDSFAFSESPLAPDMGRALVVGNSEITRVVVGKILERAGLRPVSADPEEAVRLLSRIHPGTVVLDGGADNRECDRLFLGIEALRRFTGGKLPQVILLSNANGTPQSLGLPAVVDAVAAKPITPERLQRVVERLAGRARA